MANTIYLVFIMCQVWPCYFLKKTLQGGYDHLLFIQAQREPGTAIGSQLASGKTEI